MSGKNPTQTSLSAGILAACIALFIALPQFGFAEPMAFKKDGWMLNLKNADIHAFIEQVSSITGDNFVVDPQIKGTVTVVTTTPLNKEAVDELFLSVLRVNGFTAVPSGSVTRIVPLAGAKNGGISINTQNPSDGQIITRVVSIRNSNMDDTLKMLKPLVSANGYMEGSAYSNSLIISDYADNVLQIINALQTIDKGDDGTDVEVIPLQEEWVGNIVPLLENMSPVQIGDAKSHNRLRVVANERRNSIIVRGTPKERKQIRHLVEMLDQKSSDSNDIQVISLQHADAREMAALLRGFVLNDKKGSGQHQGFPGTTNVAAAPALAGSAGAGTGQTAANAAAAATLTSLFPSSSDSTFGAQDESSQQDNSQSFIQANVTLNALVVRAEPAVMSKIRSLVKQMDVRRPQVLIEAAIFEINSTQAEQLGVQYAVGDVARSINSGTTQFSANQTGIGSILTQLGSANAAIIADGGAVALGSNRFDVLVQALANTSGANLLSTPSITTLDNTEARIVVGQNVPFRTGSYSTQAAGVAAPFTTIEREDVGVNLRVLPQIHEGNFIRLTIAQEISSIAPTTTDTAGAADIITNKRTIETKVLAEDGETVVLGGLIEDNKTASVDKVPLLGDIPVLGALFRSTSTNVTKSNLIVFLRPTILHNREDMSAVTQDRYGMLYDLDMGNKKAFNTAEERSLIKPGSLFNPPSSPMPGVEQPSLPWLQKPPTILQPPAVSIDTTLPSQPK